jgi:Zinc-finger associated domain (zf-AD).
MKNIYMLLINLFQVYVEDNLPSQVCKGCMDQVNNFSNFKLQCEKSYETLKQYWIKQEDNNTEEVKLLTM